ncbi:ShlB/FhaC/HecB family hemolysin secretion/activation protein [Campylobacter coli]|nr:ShlB/FhaC/HecB family hemolysin secretion/activation protein [Campylobacter coli]
MKRFLLKSLFLVSCFLTGALGEQNQDNVKALEQMMEISPYKNIPQNKNIQNTLKNKQSPLDIKEGDEKTKQDSNPQISLQDNSKELLDEDGLVMPSDEEFHFKYKIFIETKENGKMLTLKDLGINEVWLNEAIFALKKSDLSVQTLQDIANVVSYYFQYHGYPSATAYVPQQEIRDTIQINVVIGKLGNYKIKNHSAHLQESAVESKLRDSLKGKILKTKELEDAIYRVNEMSGIEAKGVLAAGDEFETTDVIIEIEDSTKASAVLFVDNYGSKGSGNYRAGLSGALNNVFGYGDSLNYFAQLSDEMQKSYGFTYNFFLGNLKVSPRVNKSNYELGGEYESLDAYGSSLDLGVDLSYPIFINRVNSLYLTGGYTHRKLEDVYDSFGIDFNKESDTFYLGVEGTIGSIPNNILSYNTQLTYGDVKPKSVFLENSPAMGEFWKFNAALNNTYYFNNKISHILNINYQKTIGDYQLDSSETATLGGPYGVRAYPNGFGEADSMFLTTIGLRFNVFSPNFYITPFYEFAYGWNEDYLDNDINMAGREGKNDIFVDAVGLELLYIKPNGFYIKLDLAKAAHKYEADGKRRDRLYTSMGFYF